MARTKEAKLSRSAYFKELFRENPELLKDISNDAILERWQSDHPGEILTDKIKASLSNTKSLMRKELGVRRKSRRGRKAKMTEMAAATAVRSRISAGTLESLESKIDDVLALARHHETAGLEAVVKHLRFARNGVVLMQGS